MVKILGINKELNIARDPGHDQRILSLVAEEFKKKGFEVEIKTLKELKKEDAADIILNMARSQEINDLLFEKELEGNSSLTILVMAKKEELCEVGTTQRADVILNMARGREINTVLFESEKQGVYIVNPPKSVLLVSDKKELFPMMAQAGVGIPETKTYKVGEISIKDIKEKSVLKAGNRHSIYFTVDFNDENAFNSAIQKYKKEGIEEIIVQKFIDGKFFKYYAAGDKIFLPRDVERDFSQELVQEINRQIGEIQKLTNTYIIGGDMIVDGINIYFTDVNDWPSYSGAEGVSQEEIAPYIADFIEKKYKEFKR
jgi:glutathione synthase/RimK-type ligase-like ATP-grasp enzyme